MESIFDLHNHDWFWFRDAKPSPTPHPATVREGDLKPPLYVLENTPVKNISHDDCSSAKDLIAIQTIIETFRTEDLQNELKLDIVDFTNRTKQIVSLFETIATTVKKGDADFAAYSDRAMSPIWEKYFQSFRELLWNSRDTATEIVVSCDKFQHVVLPLAAKAETDLEVESVTQLLKEHIEDNDKNKLNAKAQADKFNTLLLDVTAFKDVLQRHWKIENSLSTTRAARRWYEIDSQLETLKTKLSSLESRMQTALAAETQAFVLGSSNFMRLFPRMSLRLICAVAHTSRLQKKIEWKRREIQQASFKMQKLEAKYPSDVQACILLKTTEGNLDDIIAGLRSFEEIWACVNSDCHAIKGYLESSRGKPDRQQKPMSLIMFMKMGNTYYSGLAHALRQYATGINSSTDTRSLDSGSSV